MDSIGDNFDLVTKEIERLHDKSWHQIYTEIPFFPIRCLPNGTVARKLESSRPRRTTNASAPHDDLWDSDGEPVVSVNTAVKAPNDDGTASWPKERKPTVAAKVHDLAILRHAARLFRDETFGFCCDFSDFFSQISVAHKYQWMGCVHWLSANGIGAADGCFVNETRLGFGCSASSNIAQRLADALLGVFRRLFDAQESTILDDILNERPASDEAQWIRARRILGRGQCRLYEIAQFTDDPMFVCVSAARMQRGLRLFLRLMRQSGLELSHPRKFQAGCSLRWLGLDWHLSVGM
jgi:hypothetical protein